MNIQSCPSCANSEFYITETITHVAATDDDAVLIAYKTKHNEIDTIVCCECKKEFKTNQFYKINFP